MSTPVTIEDIYQLFQQSQAEADRRAAEADRRAAEAKAEADRSMAELKKTVAETTRAVNALTTRWGRFVEELVEPAVIQLFQARGIEIKYLYRRARSR
uniref:DUF3782 domain-containing protein n=1 Tax=Gloeomargarita lithophora TaxID=1188228 RepID=UPI003F6EF5EF